MARYAIVHGGIIGQTSTMTLPVGQLSISSEKTHVIRESGEILTRTVLRYKECHCVSLGCSTVFHEVHSAYSYS